MTMFCGIMFALEKEFEPSVHGTVCVCLDVWVVISERELSLSPRPWPHKPLFSRMN